MMYQASRFLLKKARVNCLLLSALLLGSCQTTPRRELTTPAAVGVQAAGLSNCHKVDRRLYRGAQPDAQGMLALQHMGVKSVLDLRSSTRDPGLAAGTDLRLLHRPVSAWNPTYEQMLAAQRVLMDGGAAPVMVHCLHGADRTGVVVAVYRILHHGYSKQQSVEEMRHGGFGHHAIFRSLSEFVMQLDEARLRRDLGLSAVGAK